MKQVALTTTDNPFDPIEDFDNWWIFDREHNYGSCELLDRISFESERVSDEQNLYERERAIDFIVEWHPSIYKKVVKNS